MKNITRLSLTAVLLFGTALAHATPSTQIWIPSTDIQAFGVPHFGFDTYIRTSDHGYFAADANTITTQLDINF